MKWSRIDWLAILTLCLMPLFYFAPVVFLGQTFYFHDISIDYVPLNAFNTRTTLQGELPLWNPYLAGGFPLAGQIEAAPLYLLNLILLLPLPITTTHTWYIVIHYMLAGVFTYLLARRGLHLGPMPSLIAGLTFTFSGSMIAQLTNFTLVSTLVWMPLILLLYIRALDESKIIYAVGAGLVMAVQISKSHPQIVLYTAGILALYALFAVGIDFRTRRSIRSLLPLGMLLVIFVVSAGLSAYQLFYTFELIEQSDRSGGITYDMITILSYPPLYLLKFLVPHFWGSFENYAGNGNYTGMHAYAGILPLILTPWAWLKPKDWRVWFFTTLLFICLLLSFGKFTPLYVPLQYVPVFNYFRVPARWLFLVTFCLAISAAYGAQILINKKEQVKTSLEKPARRVGMVVLFAFIGLLLMSGGMVLGDTAENANACQTENCFFCGWRPRCIFANPKIQIGYYFLMERKPEERNYYIFERVPSNSVEVERQREEEAFRQRVRLAYADMQQSLGLFLLVLSLGLSLVFARWQNWINRGMFGGLAALIVLFDMLTYGGLRLNPTTDASYFLKEPDTVQFLKQVETSEPYRVFPTITWVPHPHNVDYVLSTLHFNIPSLYGIESIEGGLTLPLRRHTAYMKRAVGRTGGLQMLGIANTKYVITEWELEGQPDLVLRFEGQSQKIFQNLLALPRTFVVHQVEVLPNDATILERLADPSFDPANVIILEEQPSEALPPTPPPMPTRAEIVTYKHNQVTINVNTMGSGLLFLSDVHYPGWNAYVDGERSHVYRANYLFRAVEVPPGKHTVEFRYEPRSFWLGFRISVLSAILVVGGITYQWAKTRSYLKKT